MNHKHPQANWTHRLLADKECKILKAEIESGIELEAKYLDHTFTVTLSPKETEKLVQSLLKQS